jgi:hypothetical protein
MFICKTQHFNYEEGEFDTRENITPEEVLKLYNDFDWQGELEKKGEEDIYPSIIVQSQDHLIKIHSHNEILLDFLYFPPDQNKYFRKRGTKMDLEEVLKKFLAMDFPSLKKICFEMNTGLIDYQPQKEKLKEKDFNYYFSINNDPIYHLPVFGFILFLGSLFFAIPKISLFILLILVTISIPVIMIFFPYYKTNKGMSVYLTRGKDDFVIIQNGQRSEYNKKNIFRIVHYFHDLASDSPFRGTYYMDILFSTGERLILNSLTVDYLSIIKKFPEQEIQNNHVAFPYIRKTIHYHQEP